MRTYSVPTPDFLLGVVVRPTRGIGDDGSQTLLFFRDGIHLLEGGLDGRPFKLGPELRCIDSETGEAFAWSPHRSVAPAYDPATDCVYFFHKCGLMQLDADNNVSLFAGSVDDPDDADGIGPAARFGWPASTAADGRGSLYVCEEYWNGFRKVRTAADTPAAEVPTSTPGPDTGGSSSARPQPGSVQTVHEASHCKFVSLACPAAAPGPGFLLAASRNALYRIPLTGTTTTTTDPSPGGGTTDTSGGSGGGGGGGGGGSGTAACTPELLAGAEDAGPSPPRTTDGPFACAGSGTGGADHAALTPAPARFEAISGLLACPDGRSVFLVDGSLLRRADLVAGVVATITALPVAAGGCCGGGGGRAPDGADNGINGINGANGNSCLLTQLALLPHPHHSHHPDGPLLAVCVQQLKTLIILQDPEFAAAAAVTTAAAFGAGGLHSASPHRSLAELLLLPQPAAAAAAATAGSCSDGGGSVGSAATAAAAAATVVVRLAGGAAVTAHRALLADRSEYFRSLLGGGFREGGADEVELPGADPAAFAALLSYMYTGVLELGPRSDPRAPRDDSALLRSAAELAERLLLPGASAQLQRLLLAAATPASLLPDLVWAERHNLRHLAARLRGAMFAQRAAVRAAAAPEVVRQLAMEYPEVLAELFLAALG